VLRLSSPSLAAAAALALLNAEHHPLTIDVADLELAQLTAAQARAVERQEQRAVIEILRARDDSKTGYSHDLVDAFVDDVLRRLRAVDLRTLPSMT